MRSRAARLAPWLITAACFAYLYARLERAASAQGDRLLPYLAGAFDQVDWWRWLALMVPYCMLFLLIDTLIVWRVVTWFNAPLRYRDVLPIRASGYILSIVNEQVGKGAIALYLGRRHGIPTWEAGSSMLFILACEYFYLLGWAALGVVLQGPRLPPAFHAIPALALASVLVFAIVYLFFRGKLTMAATVRDRPLFRAFRMARLRHYAAVIALRSPLMVAAIVVYALCLRLFGVSASALELLGYLPVIFFGAAMPGPMHSVAILLWVVLFPERPAEMAAFAFVQHNFFVLFNAAVGLLFLRRATRELFATPA
jgi:hypothetical protein